VSGLPRNLRFLPEYLDKTGIFQDRAAAGVVLAGLLEAQNLPAPLLLGIPAGGVPVAVVLSRTLGWPVRVAVVSKALLPWTTEAGFGAVAWDGTVRLNQELLSRLGLTAEEQEAGLAATRAKVARRVQAFGPVGILPELTGRAAVLVDDGLASGFTMLTAAVALRKTSAASIVVAVPTAHAEAVRLLADEVDLICCANLRGGYPFAVAAAYRNWRDVTEAEALRWLRPPA
jgi:predicted phosphoribosyltransferase